MRIYIDINRVLDSEGKARLYYPEIDWDIDSHDTISKWAMNDICDKVRREIELGLALVKTKKDGTDD